MPACNSCYICVSSWFQSKFKTLGEFIGRNPKILILVSLLVCGALGCGMVTLKFETDTEKLYTPINSQASLDRTVLKNTFKDASGTNYVPHALGDLDRYGSVVFSSSNVMDNVDEMNTYVKSILAFNVSHEGASYTYRDVCARNNGTCFISGTMILSDPVVTAYRAGLVTYPVWSNVDLARFLGDVDSTNGKLKSAKYLRITFHLRQDSDKNKALSGAWEDKFLDEMSALKPESVSVNYATSQSLDKELDSNTGGDITFFSITFTLMITYATVIAGGDMVASRTWAAYAGVLAAGMGIIAAFGLVSACGLSFVNIVGVMPFLVIGIGVDDMFLLMSGWADTYSHRDKNVAQRMGLTFASAGVGITITSITDLLAFGIGASSVFISVRNFCIYTGVAVTFCYLFQIFFFSPCLSLHGRRVESGRHCLTCFHVKSRQEYQDANKSCLVVVCCGGSAPKQRGDDERICETIPRVFLPKLLLNNLGKCMVLITFCVYLGVSIWGAYNLQQGLDLKNLASPKSHFYAYTDVIDKHFENSFPVPFIFGASTDYRNSETVAKINHLLTQAENDAHIEKNSTICWFNDYQTSPAYRTTNDTEFIQGLKAFLQKASSFQNDVVFDSSGSKILSSRCYLFSENNLASNAKADVMVRMRSLAKGSSLPVYTYHPAYIYYEQFIAVLPSTLQTVGVALAVMVIVTFIFLPHPLLVLLVLLNIVSILIGIVGFLHFWDLTLNSVTMIHLIMSVGFSVDFSVHVCSAYMFGEGNDRNERARSAIVHAAGPVLNGGLSSFLGVIVLVASSSYIFHSFFKIMFTVILFGMLHAVVVLPVVLSILGPSPPKTSTQDVTKVEGISNTQIPGTETGNSSFVNDETKQNDDQQNGSMSLEQRNFEKKKLSDEGVNETTTREMASDQTVVKKNTVVVNAPASSSTPTSYL